MAHDDVGADARPAGTLHESEERFRLLVESVMDYAIFILDPTGVITTWNTGAERLKGYSEAEIIGRHYSTFYTDEDRQRKLPDRLLATAREEGHVQISGWRVRKDGTRFWADVVITALWTGDGELTGFAKVTRDMTERHRARMAQEEALEQQRQLTTRLEELDRWRRSFMSAVTHDLIVPVISIAGFADHLLDEIEDVGHRHLLERIVSNSQSLKAMIDQLSIHARLEAGEVAMNLEPVRLDVFIGDLLADLRPVMAEHEVRTDVPPIEVPADRRGLERILRNLLGNAARHTPPGTVVTIEAHADHDPVSSSPEGGRPTEPVSSSPEGGRPTEPVSSSPEGGRPTQPVSSSPEGGRPTGTVTIVVSDDGPGIPEALRGRLFDRSSHGASGGTGLGLSIVKEYVELHGGVVDVESGADQGATFRVTLPAGPAP